VEPRERHRQNARSRATGVASVAGIATLALLCQGAHAASPPDLIRVGGPSAPNEAKLAIVASQGRLDGHGFAVLRGGRVVLRGRLRRAIGSPSPWRHAATADITAIKQPGSYRVRVAGLISPAWRVQLNPWRGLIRRLLRIYAVNADGSEPNPVFGPSHLNDAQAPIKGGPTDGGTVDVTGGWRDAGDAIKFTTTTAVSSVMLDYVALLDPGDAQALAAMSNIGVRYLVKAHPAGSQTFIAQVGDTTDHDVVGATFARDFANDDTLSSPAWSHRIAYGDAGSGPLGAGAAALASAAMRAGPTTPAGMALIQLATEWYTRGKAVAGPGPELRGFPQPGALDQRGQPNGDWQGFMALAAVQLWRAGFGDGFLDEARGFLAATHVDQGFNPYVDVGGLGAADICGGLGRPPVARADVRGPACRTLADIGTFAAGRAAGDAFASPGVFQFGWVQDATGGAALAAAGARAGVFQGGLRLAAGARDYLLGRNPWGASFVMGPARNEAHDPQHSVIIKGDASRLGDGFVVGGPAFASQLKAQGLKPDQCEKPHRHSPLERFDPTYGGERVIYEDCREDYVTSEVGLAYTDAALMLLGELAAR
jgi:hypothetical protein